MEQQASRDLELSRRKNAIFIKIRSNGGKLVSPLESRGRERELFVDNLLVRIHYHRDDYVNRPRAMGI